MRPLNASARHFLVQKLRLSNKEATALILAKRFLVNGQPAQLNQPLQPEDEVSLDGKILKEAQQFHYLAYYKPRGIETTLNEAIPDNLTQALNFPVRVYPIGRLDKDSEGLLLLTNDGSIFDKILHSEQKQEKEYVVRVDKPLTSEVISALASGVEIMGKKTRPAEVKQLDEFTFNIILTQGLNRQIRRMCYKLGYEVLELKRVRIVHVELGGLQVGEWRELGKEEVAGLKSLV
ncbi:pseudouridine synthase [Adhaeribacter soli]|uniref:Pseudouridine synthase n=1 Tax=Adhaeribacter soli TaxID=2607655 RepID=A0A5N1J0K8_9BACT|nr:pseudouridine synthase [Adhaeribacter soli]KAA9340235.1 pseudouridine synthase [Adhaeribacter soli]